MFLTCEGTTISWRSVKQTIAGTSSNHAEILAIHEASRECVWLRTMTQHIRRSCCISSERRRHLQFCMKIMQHALLNLKKVISRAIGQNIFCQSSFSRMTYKRMVTLLFNKFAQVTIWRIYLTRHFLPQLLGN